MMMLMLAIGAWAETVTFADEGYSNGEAVESYEGTDFTVTFDKGTNSNAPKYYTTGAAIRVYGGNCFTVSSSTKTISKIEFTFASGGGTNVLTSDVEAYEDGIWEGSSSAVTFTVSGTSGHLRLAAIAVTFDDGTEPPVTVATPVITGETPFDENTEVTITCATEGASIYYTLDGADPTSASTPYAGAFELTETTTVKAIAYDATGAASSVATKEFVKEEPVVLTNVATVAEFNALPDNTVFTFTGSLVATGQTGKYLYAEDSDGILIYGNIGQTYSDLAVIPGGWTGKKTTYAGAPEAADPAGFAAATDHADLAPEEMTPAQVTVDNAFRYAVIRGATIDNGNLVVGNESVALYNSRFNVDVPTDGGVYDVIGITGFFNNPQFMPLEFVAQATEVAAPVITGETPFVGSTTVTITCETEGVSIYYTIDGTEPSNQSTAYTAPFELTESATVKAYAYDATGAVSALATKEFVKKISCATVSEILALENNTTFAFTGELVVIGQAGQRLYAQDEAGDGIFFYGTAPSYEMYDVIPAGWSAKRATYKGAPELANMTDMAEATETAELTAAEMTPAEVTVDPYNLFFYAVIKGATIEDGNIVVADNSVAIYDRFGVATPDDAEGKIYDIYGVPSWYEGAQFFPIEFVEVVEKTESPEIAYVEGDTEYLIFVNGVGELKLYVEDMEVEIPYVVVRTNEDQTITFVATAQEEGKEISDPTVLTIIVPKLEISEIEQLFVVGTFNSWSQETGMIELIENENNEFVGDVELEAGAEFKLFTPYGDGLKWFGGEDANGVGYFLINSDMLETPITLIEGANFRVEEAGNYNITVAEAESKGVQEPLVMTIKKNTPEAIEAINMENVKAVRYYNVAGVESLTPFQGVNIVVREMTDGTKNVTKMIK